MNLHEYAAHDATGLAELVRSRAISAQELAETARAAIDRLNPRLNAFAELYDDAIAGAAAGVGGDGAFGGVPFALKRIGISEAGRPMGDLGSRMLRGVALPVADSDSYVVARFRAAGLTVMGHTQMPELAYTVTVESSHQGVTVNPWNPDIVAGGSSTGSAVAVASGMLPMAHASDAAGSTRFPASCNGLVGMKPSRGWISVGPADSDLTSYKVSHFALTRTVRDAATMLDVLQGGEPGEAAMYRRSDEPFAAAITRPPRRLRIALATEAWHTRPLQDDVAAEITRIGRELEALGHHVEEARPPIDFDAYRDLYKGIYYMDGAIALAGLQQLLGGDADPELLQPVIRKATSRGDQYAIADYAGIFSGINVISRVLGAFFESYDALLTPALATGIPRLGETTLESDASAEEFIEHLLGINQHLPLANLTGTPAISLPLCRTQDGMPLGAHFMMPIGNDAALLQLAAELEQALPWKSDMPPIYAGRT
ncbi:hypothetical protein MB02_14420 [Croceicoccus estronivorus]|uniref:amidase n=1 Tax=Croceicoccus estronivorus TaxID=1172626 RepID=UPI00082A8FAA|nr:amidase [Croceicoccus estronivorus]OCC22956.1 hypothetical protein MB02_14420 [Croceicoccus estronivorus]